MTKFLSGSRDDPSEKEDILKRTALKRIPMVTLDEVVVSDYINMSPKVVLDNVVLRDFINMSPKVALEKLPKRQNLPTLYGFPDTMKKYEIDINLQDWSQNNSSIQTTC